MSEEEELKQDVAELIEKYGCRDMWQRMYEESLEENNESTSEENELDIIVICLD